MRIENGGIGLHVNVSGMDDAPAIMFANSLGTNLHLWDEVLPHLPDGMRVIRYDMRGHGQSDVPDAPYTMGQLVSDAEAVCDTLNIRDCLFVGLSVGGMVAQGLAIKRPDLIRAMVLSNTAAKIGNASLWKEWIDTIKAEGMAAQADNVMKRWFGRDVYGTAAVKPWRDMLLETPQSGYLGTCAAIAGTDFYPPTSGLRLPTLGIAGRQDAATPPDLVRETVDLIPGSRFALMQRAGHLPCTDDPKGYADLLNQFIADTGHLHALVN